MASSRLRGQANLTDLAQQLRELDALDAEAPYRLAVSRGLYTRIAALLQDDVIQLVSRHIVRKATPRCKARARQRCVCLCVCVSV